MPLDQEMLARGGIGAPPGPAAGAFVDPALAGAAAGENLTPPQSRGLMRFFRGQPKPKAATAAEQWGSPLMLVGGGFLLVMLITCAAVFWSLNRYSDEKAIEEANNSYKGGSYHQAIEQYKSYLENAGEKGKFSSMARVKLALAELREIHGVKDWPAALKKADEVVQTIPLEANFKDARPELTVMLPDIAEGLAEAARQKPTQTLLDQGRKALDLAMRDELVPKTDRPVRRMEDVTNSLAVTVREIARGDLLGKTLVLIQAALKQANTKEAYAACSTALRQYPDLATNAKLKEALLQVSQVQQRLVKQVSDHQPADRGGKLAEQPASLTLARPELKAEVPDVAGQMVVTAVDGAVYGLEAASGKVLWRRFVGFDANPQAPLLPRRRFRPSREATSWLPTRPATTCCGWRARRAGSAGGRPSANRSTPIPWSPARTCWWPPAAAN